MTLEDIQTAISECTTAELEGLLRDMRHNRTKEDIIITKVREKKNALDKMLDGMTPEMARQLLAQLGGK